MGDGPSTLQFGTSRFLQAHVDLFVAEAAANGAAVGGICVVQSTGRPASVARMQALARPEGYEVIVRGLVGGQPLERRITCRSVHEALDARHQWPQVRQRMCRSVRVIVSNTGDTGWLLQPGEGPDHLDAAAPPPSAFAAKLLVLLHDRWRQAVPLPLSVLPCELVERNGDRLHEIVAGLAREWGCGADFGAWLDAHVVWANTLVDRIVPEALEPAGAVAEPYALWAIEARERLELPCTHPAIVVTDDLQRYERLKLYFLNLGHTVLADRWLHGGHPADMTVLQAMHDAQMRPLLEAVWRHEVRPVFDALGLGREAGEYVVALRDRLLNPFLAHRLADIAVHHAQKKARRIEPLLALAGRVCPGLPQPLLRAALADGCIDAKAS